jgi:transposase
MDKDAGCLKVRLLKGHIAVRATTLLNNLLDLPGVTVASFDLHPDAGTMTIGVRLRRKRLVCPEPDCGYSTRWRVDTRLGDSSWRSLDMGSWKVTVTTRLRRLRCPDHGVIVEGVPFARQRVRFTRDFEDLVAWAASKTDKTAVTRLLRIAWPTVGVIIERVVADGLDADRLDGLYDIGVDEISWKKHHHYLTVVVDHASGDVVWTGEGKNTAALDAFFTELGPERAAQLRAVSMDMGKAYPKSVAKKDHAPQATICWDPFHVVAMGTKALNAARRAHWNQLRDSAEPDLARRFKGARWALLKNPEDLSDKQADSLAAIRRTGGAVWRAYKGKEALRAIFAGDLTEKEVIGLLDRWCAWAQRSRLSEFVKLGRTIRAHRHGILAAIRLGLSNGRVEGRNATIRLLTRRAYGFHSAAAAGALVMLVCGPITLQLPHEK